MTTFSIATQLQQIIVSREEGTNLKPRTRNQKPAGSSQHTHMAKRGGKRR